MHNIWAKYNGTYLIKGTKCCLEYTVKTSKMTPPDTHTHTHFIVMLLPRKQASTNISAVAYTLEMHYEMYQPFDDKSF